MKGLANAKALQFACRSLSIWEQIFGREHSHVAKILYNLAGRRDLVGDTTGALEFYIRSLAIFKRVNGMRSEEVADALDGIADVKWRLGETKDALICYQRSSAKTSKDFNRISKSSWHINNC